MAFVILGTEKFLSHREAARFLNVSERTLTRYRLEGKIKAIKYSSRKYVYRREDLEEFLESKYGTHEEKI